jgi:hypothetical protein
MPASTTVTSTPRGAVRHRLGAGVRRRHGAREPAGRVGRRVHGLAGGAQHLRHHRPLAVRLVRPERGRAAQAADERRPGLLRRAARGEALAGADEEGLHHAVEERRERPPPRGRVREPPDAAQLRRLLVHERAHLVGRQHVRAPAAAR